MITLNNVSLNFNGTNLFSDVNIRFSAGNCYGIIGANGAGKSTFLRILSGDLDSSTGDVCIKKGMRLSELKQDQYAYDEYSVLDTIMLGNPELYKIMKDKEVLYAKEDFTLEDGNLAAELEERFAELNGWEAESDASILIQGLGFEVGHLEASMKSLTGNEKVKVLLAQALFGKPDIILLDEPTNNLDIKSVYWLEDFIMDYVGTVIVVSHDRHFLNTVCTHIVDIDYKEVKVYVGNYDFWYESSQLIQRLKKNENKKNEDKAKDLQNFIARFSANKSKARQATSRKKLLEKLTFDDMPASSRKSPFVGFQMDRDIGKEIFTVDNLSKTIDGVKVLNNISFVVNKDEKIAFVGDEIAVTTFFKIIMGEMEPDSGTYKWGITTSQSYFPKDNTKYFNKSNMNMLHWIQQYSKDKNEIYLRGFLGRMLFSNDDVFKQVKVLSGGEKVRCMLARMMMKGANVLVVNQPTNHLDLESITAVNNGMIDFKGVILFFSHDHQFVNSIANRIIEFVPEGKIDKLTTYDEYLQL
ncbi:MAG: ATP-binding cassette domain-containing protein [Clostridia bacterium]